MKKRKTKPSPQASLIGCMAMLTILAWLAPVLAQSQRYPTATEMRRLREQFRQKIQLVERERAHYFQGRRTQQEKQARESFVRAWSKVDPVIAPFLGSWATNENSLNIYPSNTRGRVCLIWTGDEDGKLILGSVSNGQIRARDARSAREAHRSLFFREGKYLGSAVVENNKPKIDLDIPLNSPSPLEAPPRGSIYESIDAQQTNEIVRKFNAAGCTDSLPRRR